MPQQQCKKCPWRVDVDPNTIPNGYCRKKHANLKGTVATPGEVRLGGPLRMMACHESMPGRERPCVGWLANQLGPGNNIQLRVAVLTGHVEADDIRLVGEQHQRFEDTLPKETP